jgi:uncharacterized protein (DUF1778 family)
MRLRVCAVGKSRGVGRELVQQPLHDRLLLLIKCRGINRPNHSSIRHKRNESWRLINMCRYFAVQMGLLESFPMPAAPERRSERLEVRVPPSLHARVAEAAALRGLTVAAFVTTAVEEAAQRAITDAQTTRLSAAEFERLLLALDQATEPNAALQAAMTRRCAHDGGSA